MEIRQLDTQIYSHSGRMLENTRLRQCDSGLPPRFCEIKFKVTLTQLASARAGILIPPFSFLLCHLGCLFMELAILTQGFSVGISEAPCVTLNTFSNSCILVLGSCQPLRNLLIPPWDIARHAAEAAIKTKIKGPHLLLQELVLDYFNNWRGF